MTLSIDHPIVPYRFPVAFCGSCQEKVTVYLRPFPKQDGGTLILLHCSRCSSPLNIGKRVLIEWVDRVDLFRVTGDRVFAQVAKYNPRIRKVIS